MVGPYDHIELYHRRFSPTQILLLVLGESLLLGAGAGLASAALTYAGINWGLGGIAFPIAFFDRFLSSAHALWWGPAMGGLVGCALGMLTDGWTATSVVTGHSGGGKFVVFQLIISARTLAVGVLVSLIMGVLEGLLSALSAMRLRPLEALR